MVSSESLQKDHADTLLLHCPGCGSDTADTLGVTGAMDGSLRATVVMRCGSCMVVYLSPPPACVEYDAEPTLVQGKVYDRRLREMKQGIPDNTRVLCADVMESSVFAHKANTDQFDLVQLPLTLESSQDPAAMLDHIATILDSEGRIEIAVGNVESSSFAVFGGRHWFGYRFPMTRQHFCVQGMEALAAKASLRVTGKRTLAAPHAWLSSLKNLCRDWNLHRVTTWFLTGPWLLPWLVASLLESLAVLRGRGSILIVQMQKVH